MGDIEETIFQRNVPGRWSRHEEEHGNLGNEASSDDEDEGIETCDDRDQNSAVVSQVSDIIDHAKRMNEEGVPESVSRIILSKRLNRPRTGVKGVLADYNASIEAENAIEAARQKHRNTVIWKMAAGSAAEAENCAEEEEDLDDVDEFLAEYRVKRLQELQAASALPAFGECKDVTNETFLDEVDKEHPNVVVVVHLYEPSVQACVKMNRSLEQVATEMTKVKFLRLSASSNGIEIDRRTLPILSLYRGGEVVEVLAGVTEELGDRCAKEDVEWLLESAFQRNGISV